jgi:hypothetical protein
MSPQRKVGARNVAGDDARDNVDKMVDRFDICDFEDTGLELPERLRTPDSLIARLNRAAAEYRNDEDTANAGQRQEGFFGFVNPSTKAGPDDRRRRNALNLSSIVTRAYADVRSERSIDYMVADPEANLLFLQRCWELGAPASPFELNWVLMNARKDRKLGALPRAKRFSIPKERLDHFSFAVDIAMRAVQERLYYAEDRGVSIDQVLCDPHLAREFDAYAHRIVPEQSSLECRWAIMTLRKARRASARSFRAPTLGAFELLEDVRVQGIPKTCGTYWVRADDGSLFTGVATNLRVQVDQLIQRVGHRVVPPWITDQPKAKPRIVMRTTDSYEAGEIFRAGVFKRAGSRLNFWNGEFFGSAA